MNTDEHKITHSFKLAKTDIARLQRQMDILSATQQRLMEMMDTLKSHQLKMSQKIMNLDHKPVFIKVKSATKKTAKKKVTKKPVKVVKKPVKRSAIKFVASKSGKKFHIEACPFAKNIKPKYKVRFKSKVKALNDGYKPCTCVK